MNEKLDKELKIINDAKKGKKEAFEMLVKKYQNRVFRQCYHNFYMEKENAEDAAQEAFVKAYKGLKNFRRSSSFSTWLYRITENVCRDFYNKRKRKVNLIKTEADFPVNEEGKTIKSLFTVKDNPEKKSDIKIIKKQIVDCIKELSEIRRSIVYMCYYDGEKYKNVADKLNIKIGTVRSNLHRGILEIKECLKRKGILQWMKIVNVKK